MSTSLPKLYILLQDMLSNAKAIRTQQWLNHSFGEKDYITLLDVKERYRKIWIKRDSFMNFDEINPNNAGDFLMENVVFYFFMRAIQIKDSAFFKEETRQLKDLIFKTIGYIHSKALMDESLEQEREFFDYALGFYIGTASKEMKMSNPIWYSSFKPLFDYVSNAQNSENFSVLVNEIIVKYFYIFCDLPTIDKKNMYTELGLVEKRISEKEYTHKILLNWNIEDIYKMVCIDCLIRGKEKQIFLKKIMAKVFYNEYSIEYALPNNRIHTNDAYFLFQEAFKIFADSLDDVPGVIACMYLISKEMGFDEFCNFFKQPNNDSDNRLTEYYLKKIDETLELEYRINRQLEMRGETGKHYRRWHDLFSEYKDPIKKGKGEEVAELDRQRLQRDLGLSTEPDTRKKLLQKMLWFVVFEKIGLLYNDAEMDHIRKEILVPFANGTLGNEYGQIAYINKMFNGILEKFGVKNKIDLSIDKHKDYWGIILLTFNLSRTEHSKEYLFNIINYLKEKQINSLHIDTKRPDNREDYQCDIDDIDEYNEQSLRNRLKLKELDCGFCLEKYAQRIYPLSLKGFLKRGVFLNGFERKITCKLFWETDNEFTRKGTKESLDFPSINRKGLTTRYLYRDRNAYSHHTGLANVISLLKPRNWESLLKVLGDFDYLLNGKLWAQRLAYLGGYGTREDDFFFQNKFLQLEVEKTYYDLTMLIQRKYGVEQKVFQIYDSENKRFLIDDFIQYIKSNTQQQKVIFSYDEQKDKDSSYADLLPLRLERILKIMFMVNDTDPRGQEHSVKFMDFYSQYNTQISIYLIYMAFALNYCDDIKV